MYFVKYYQALGKHLQFINILYQSFVQQSYWFKMKLYIKIVESQTRKQYGNETFNTGGITEDLAESGDQNPLHMNV